MSFSVLLESGFSNLWEGVLLFCVLSTGGFPVCGKAICIKKKVMACVFFAFDFCCC